MASLTGSVAHLYALLHRGTPGDLRFYRSVCAGGSRVLELGSGSGRVALDLAARGHVVTGMDVEPALIDVAREQVAAVGEDARERLRFIEGDIRDFDLDERFDRIIVPFNTLCCLLTRSDLEGCFRSASRHLEPGGLFAFDIYRGDPDTTVDEGETHLVRIDDGARSWDVYERARAHDDPFRADTCYRFRANGDEERHLTIAQRLVTDDEVERALQLADLSTRQRFGGFEGEPLDDDSPHLVVVAERPG
ncbi:MAG TPA: class I SAM-dependent methyltransferase [Polyangiaceae bacterium]|nr:class I SAM-dependent methyltransferase [Polyangiaceae bacterium]